MTDVGRISLALRGAGFDRWSCSGPQAHPQLFWVQASARPGWVQIGPLDGGRAELPAAAALRIIRAFAERRDAAAEPQEPGFGNEGEAEELWGYLYNDAEAHVLGRAA